MTGLLCSWDNSGKGQGLAISSGSLSWFGVTLPVRSVRSLTPVRQGRRVTVYPAYRSFVCVLANCGSFAKVQLYQTYSETLRGVVYLSSEGYELRFCRFQERLEYFTESLILAQDERLRRA